MLTFLTLFCLIILPFCEGKILPPETNHIITVIHGIILWLFGLTTYLVATHCVKLKASLDLDKKLVQANSILVKANLLCSFEDLGILDCSKLSVSF